MTSTCVRAVVQGPAQLHAYSQFRGARLFVVPAQTGTDEDCRGGRGGAAIAPDRWLSVAVPAGHVACASCSADGIELLWHVHRPAHSGALLATRAR